MRIHIAALIFPFTIQVCHASDKDILRDACALQKLAAKRSECFDAVERAFPTAPKPAMAPASQEQKHLAVLNPRGLECQRFEFAELDSLSGDDLHALYCSYTQGFQNYKERSDTIKNESGDPRVKAPMMHAMIEKASACLNNISGVQDLLIRKFPSFRPECDAVVGFKSHSPDTTQH